MKIDVYIAFFSVFISFLSLIWCYFKCFSKEEKEEDKEGIILIFFIILLICSLKFIFLL